MPTPFEYVRSYSDKQGDLMLTEKDEEDYTPFTINTIMSLMPDTIFFANEINRMWRLDNKLQHDFYYCGIPKGKRSYKWQKKEIDHDDILLVSEFFTINKTKASKYLEILSVDQLKIIREKMDKGGRNGKA
jgi:hypothetical protein